jgi:transcriptional regulator with XRE-family HTH domain
MHGMGLSSLHERMRLAVGEHATYRQVSDRTGTHAETVRRYMQGQAPSVEFVAALCRVFGISADWLLTGRGPMKAADLKGHVLGESSAGELFTAVAENLEGLLARVDRLERYVQTLETQVRGLGHADGTESGHVHDTRQEPADPPSLRLRQLREALAQRSRPDAR